MVIGAFVPENGLNDPSYDPEPFMVENDLIAVWWRTSLREAVWARGPKAGWKAFRGIHQIGLKRRATTRGYCSPRLTRQLRPRMSNVGAHVDVIFDRSLGPRPGVHFRVRRAFAENRMPIGVDVFRVV